MVTEIFCKYSASVSGGYGDHCNANALTGIHAKITFMYTNMYVFVHVCILTK